MEKEQKFCVTHSDGESSEISEWRACECLHAKMVVSLGWVPSLTNAEAVIEEVKAKGELKVIYLNLYGHEDWVHLRLIKDAA